ncbi:chromate transporter [Paenibacillus protaetiae]|uniref:Chromate transporter n=2 Tax=Paenibacillus protaetiae TaxID=2509456 RepID=A0A4P6F0E6_9BACL|nr:chromate transporter [Paenibacillus protaetiae]
MLWPLFWTFCRIGPATFGGGYAMIPLIEQEAVHNKKWISPEDMNELLSLAGSAPGGVGVNAAALIGFRQAGIAGAAAAVAGIALPSFAIVFMLSLLFTSFHDNPKVQAALKGMQGAIIALIALAAYRMAKSALFDLTTIVIAASTIAVLLLTSVTPVSIIMVGLFIGIVWIQLKRMIGLRIQFDKAARPSVQDEIKYPEYYI